MATMHDDPTLEVDRVDERDRTVLRLTGELDASTVDILFEAVEPAPAVELVLDLSDLAFVDSSGLRAFAAISEGRRGSGGEVEIVNPSPSVERIFEIVGVDRLEGVQVRTTTS